MSILIIRHGETVDNASRTFQTPQSPLSTNGERQAELLAERLGDFKVSSILCSDYLRTQQTAAKVSQALSIDIELTPLLRERNFGDIRGEKYADLKVDPFGLDYQPVNGESWEVFNTRVAQTWKRIIECNAQTKNDLAVITHGFVCRSIVANHALLPNNFELPNHWGNTSITQLRPSDYSIELLNCNAHLNDFNPQDLGIA